MRNLRKCIDRIIRKVVAKIEEKNMLVIEAEAKTDATSTTTATETTSNQDNAT